MSKVSTALVTGGAGFIGSHIVDKLINKGITTYVIDNLSTGTLDNLARHRANPLLHVLIGDARDVSSLIDKVNVDVVFHEAAIASVPKSVSYPLLVHDVNVNMTLHVLNYCVRANVKRFVFASSAAVYGAVEGRASEDLNCRPSSPYGASKLAVEGYLHAYRQTYGLETVALRYFNVYGSRQRYNDYSGVITTFASRLLSGQRPVIYGDGRQIRDFVHVDDIVQSNMLAIDSYKAVGEALNVASGRPTSILELSRIIKGLVGASHLEDVFDKPRAGDTKIGLASIEKIRQVLGFGPRVQMDAGLKALIESMGDMRLTHVRAGEAA